MIVNVCYTLLFLRSLCVRRKQKQPLSIALTLNSPGLFVASHVHKLISDFLFAQYEREAEVISLSKPGTLSGFSFVAIHAHSVSQFMPISVKKNVSSQLEKQNHLSSSQISKNSRER
jgi:hypothetical protein